MPEYVLDMACELDLDFHGVMDWLSRPDCELVSLRGDRTVAIKLGGRFYQFSQDSSGHYQPKPL